MDRSTPPAAANTPVTTEPKVKPEAEVDLSLGGEVEIEYVVTTGDIDEWRRVSEPGALQSFEPQSPAGPADGRRRYSFRKLLGKGGMGEVRLCKDQMIG